MPDNNEKLAVFTAAILDRARAQAEKLRADTERAESDAVGAFESEKRAESERQIALGRQKAEQRAERTVTAGKLRSRRALLQFREDCAGETFDALTARLGAFTETDDYAECLCDLLLRGLGSVPGQGTVTVCLREQDLRFAEKLAAEAPNARLKFASGSFTLGGLVLVSEEAQRRVDMSFDSALEDMSGRFSELTGFDVEDRHGQ